MAKRTKRATGAGFRSPIVLRGVVQYRAVCHHDCPQNLAWFNLKRLAKTDTPARFWEPIPAALEMGP